MAHRPVLPMEPPPPLPEGIEDPNPPPSTATDLPLADQPDITKLNPGDIIECHVRPYDRRIVTDKKTGQKQVRQKYLKAVKLFNLEKAQWGLKAISALGDFVAYMTPQRVAAVLLFSAFDVLEQLKRDMATCRAITTNTDTYEGTNPPIPKASLEDKLTAQKRLTEYIDAYRTLIPEVMRLAKEAQPEGSKKEKPRFNLPPQVTVPVQVNVNGARSPGAPLTPDTAQITTPAPDGNGTPAAASETPAQ